MARRFGLSRSTLLYYDRIGVLRPSKRSAAGYRCYSRSDIARLARICRYRRAGIALADIRAVLDSPLDGVAHALAARLESLDRELRRVREQQRAVLGLLGGDPGTFLTAPGFVALLECAGVDAGQRARFHAAVERLAAPEHRALLAFLSVSAEDVARIRSLDSAHPVWSSSEGPLT